MEEKMKPMYCLRCKIERNEEVPLEEDRKLFYYQPTTRNVWVHGGRAAQKENLELDEVFAANREGAYDGHPSRNMTKDSLYLTAKFCPKCGHVELFGDHPKRHISWY